MLVHSELEVGEKIWFGMQKKLQCFRINKMKGKKTGYRKLLPKSFLN